MKKFVAIIAFVGITGITLAQNKLLTVKDSELGARRELNPAYLPNIKWRGTSSNFTYQMNNCIYQQSATDSSKIKLMTLSEINQIIQNYDTLAFIPHITWENENEFHFYTDTYWFAIKLPAKELIAYIKLPANAANFKLYYPKKIIAYTIGNNVFISGTTNPSIPVTNDANPDIVNGEFVSRNEFGINEGLFWSPAGNYLAFYRKDNSKVRNYPLVDITAREAEVRNIKYPMAGMASENVSLGIYSISSKSKVFIEKDDTTSEKYLTNITWSPDERNLYIQVLNREQNRMVLNKYNVFNGLIERSLFEEKNDRYVEPLNPLYFITKTPYQFIYLSRRDGFNHAYLYNTNGELIKQLTKGNWEITDILGLDPNDNLYYTSTEKSAIEQHAYRLDCKTAKKTELTTVPGIHNVYVNSKAGYCIDVYSNTITPRITDIISASGKLVRHVLTSPNPLSSYNMPEMTISTIKSADGVTDLYYRLIKPVNFDPSRKYPAIVYVYGGPHTQLITNSWLGGARLWDHMMAQKGYVVLTVDNRGSSNRGLAFENVIHRQCGQNEMLDQMEGIKLLKSLGYVDSARIGVHGWSYGGFMTTSLMVNYPNVFKVGVAGGPVIDWKYYEIMYGERYMDRPDENPSGYEKTSLIAKAKNLKGKLLIIHGAVDPTVVWQNSLLFINECIKNQVPVDYFVYPDAEHNVRGPDRVHLMEKITDYFDRNL